MNNIVPIRSRTGALTRKDAVRLEMFRKTVGKELTADEVNWAVDLCEVYGANPFTRDIFFFVFNANDPEKRRVEPVLAITLYRKIAARTGNYRPDDKPARFTYDEALVSPANPRGILDCELSVYQYLHGEWHAVTERLRWDERAPIIEEGEGGYRWEDTGEVWEDSGKPKKKKVPVGAIVAKLDPSKKNWAKMPETMLAKCVEAAAIRKAWPNETAGSYAEGELDAAHTLELTAVEIADNYASERRMKQVGAANSILIQWDADGPIVQVPVGQLGDRALEWLRANKDAPGTVKLWTERNRFALQEYWGRDRSGALALKKAIEPILAEAE